MSSAPLRGIGYHVGRIERRVILVFAVFGMAAGWTFAFHATIFLWLMKPAGSQLSPFNDLPIVTSPVDALLATLQLSLRGGVVVTLPVAAVSILTLFNPLLTRRRFWFLLAFIPIAYACFLAGAMFAYYVMVPAGLGFLLGFGQGFTVYVIHLEEYIGLVTALMFVMGMIFELPVVMFILSALGVISYERFKRFRWQFYIAAAILAGFITPTFDVFNLLLIVIPQFLMFEVGLRASWTASRYLVFADLVEERTRRAHDWIQGPHETLHYWLWLFFYVGLMANYWSELLK